jgi:hypothetical protein
MLYPTGGTHVDSVGLQLLIRQEGENRAPAAAWKRHIGDRWGCTTCGVASRSGWRTAYRAVAGSSILAHSASDVTGLYERRELLAWLEEDATRLRDYAGIELAKVASNPDIHPDQRYMG